MSRDRRRIGQATLLLAITLAAGESVSAPPAFAQGFGWGFYRAPVQRRRASHRRTTAQPPKGEVPVEPAREAQAPLPVPRPHFPGDAPAPIEAQPKAAETPSPRVEPALPDRGAARAERRMSPAEKPVYGPFKPAVDAQPKAPDPTAPVPSTPPPTNPPMPPQKPAELAKPGIAPSGARLGEEPGQPADDATCLDRVKARGVEVEPTEIGPQPDSRCTVVRPVHLESLTLQDGSKVSFPERPTIACTLADTFSLYIRDLLSPLAKGTYGAAVASVWTGPGLECRSRDHIQGAKLSAHGQGLAVDIAQLKLTDGRMFEVGRPTTEIDRGFEAAAHAGGCGYFHTALGPGADAFHATHWHFDLEVRGAKGDSKFCQ